MRFSRFALGCSLALWLSAGCELLVSPDKSEVGRGDGNTQQGGDGDQSSTDPSHAGCTLKCDAGYHCDTSDGRDQCVADDKPPTKTCADVSCPDGTSCVESDKGPQCLTSNDNPCADVSCKDDEVCKVKDGKGVCVANPSAVTCGNKTCAVGQVCCNESCSICTAPDETCTQEACVTPTTCDDLMCRDGTHCELGDAGPACVVDEDPCANVDCGDTGCTVQNGEPVCTDPCDGWDCDQGFKCDASSGSAECVPKSCDVVDCKHGQMCSEEGVPHCVDPASCDNITCPAHQKCQIKNDQPQCVPDDSDPCSKKQDCDFCTVFGNTAVCYDPCKNVHCQNGQHCEAPTGGVGNTLGHCVADGDACGKVTCNQDQVCCNPSCGVCTAPDGGCTDQTCD
jgi:hypothetical protein